jgi:cadmium resistance protein CadD (predicted permease)
VARRAEGLAERHLHSRLLAVAAVTVANGGDNLAAWIPLFTRQPARLLVDGLLFAALTALWCWLGWRLVQWPRLGDALRRHGDLLLAVVLIVLGLLLLGGAL